MVKQLMLIVVVVTFWPAAVPAGKALPDIRKVEIGKGNELLVNGKPFFPMIMTLAGHWHEGHADVGRQGFNVIDTYGFNKKIEYGRKDLDNARANGLYGVVTLNDLWGNLPGLAETIAALKDHPALLAWVLPDEPDLTKGRTRELCRQMYETIKRLDPNHPVWLNLSESNHAYKGVCDIISEDSYPVQDPIAHYDISLPVMHVDRLREFVNRKKPVWMYVQTYHVNYKCRIPTPAEVRCLTYLGIAHGVKGIAFYSFHEPGDKTHGTKEDGWRLSRDEPKLWASLKDLNKEISRLAPVILSADSSAETSVDITSPLSRRRDQWGFSPIHTILKKHKGTLYLFAVNGFREKIAAQYKISRVGAFVPKSGARSVLEEREIPIRKTGSGAISFEDRFEELGVRVYKIEGKP